MRSPTPCAKIERRSTRRSAPCRRSMRAAVTSSRTSAWPRCTTGIRGRSTLAACHARWTAPHSRTTADRGAHMTELEQFAGLHPDHPASVDRRGRGDRDPAMVLGYLGEPHAAPDLLGHRNGAGGRLGPRDGVLTYPTLTASQEQLALTFADIGRRPAAPRCGGRRLGLGGLEGPCGRRSPSASSPRRCCSRSKRPWDRRPRPKTRADAVAE